MRVVCHWCNVEFEKDENKVNASLRDGKDKFFCCQSHASLNLHNPNKDQYISFIGKQKTTSTKKKKGRDYHKELIVLLGGRCMNPNCKWVNDDGSRGCTDERCLQIDHINGDGTKCRALAGNAYTHFKNVIADPDRAKTHQLLCANCNWIKRDENQEVSTIGAIQRHHHVQPLARETLTLYKNRINRLQEMLPTLSPEDATKAQGTISHIEGLIERGNFSRGEFRSTEVGEREFKAGTLWIPIKKEEAKPESSAPVDLSKAQPA